MERWPAMMKRKTVAEYCEISEAEVVRRVSAGELPGPIQFGKVPHWHKESIDQRLREIAGEDLPEWKRKLYSDAA